MSPDLLHVITVIANPVRWKSRIELYKLFANHMLDSGVQLHVVECAYGDRPYELAPYHKGHHDHRHHGVNAIGVRSNSLVWNKENLVNIGLTRLPEDWKYVAWIDADVIFRNPTWAEDTVHALQQFDIVQPWTHCYDLGPKGEHMQLHRSFCNLYCNGKPIVQGPNAKGAKYEFAHPGYAWAATRRVIDAVGGLVETAALGAADHHMALALVDRVHDSIPNNMTEGYVRPLMKWQRAARQHIASNIGYVNGTIEHQWHGSKDARKYVDRWRILQDNNFDPDLDLKYNSHGVMELAGNKPKLRHGMNQYFTQRNEDSNSM